MTQPTHSDTHSTRTCAALDILFTYLKINIMNIYTNKFMHVLLKINLVGIAQC